MVSGDREKLNTLARKYKVRGYSYEQYADCLNSGLIDAVYIALPNYMHGEYTEAAARAGIHVLCEKPMAMDEAECESMIAAAQTAKIKLMVAYRLHFERGNLQAVEWVNSGKIGEPKIFSSVFSQVVKAGNSRLSGVNGGPPYDMGIYCINAARYLFRSEPLEVMGWNFGGDPERLREVPATTTAVMRFPEEHVATFSCSFDVSDRSAYEVIGTKGTVKVDPAYEMASALKGGLTVGSRTSKRTFAKRDQFAPELEYFSDCILNDIELESSGREGLADVRVIRAIVESAENNRPVSVKKTEVNARPTLQQEIAKPAINNPPSMVRAEPPAP